MNIIIVTGLDNITKKEQQIIDRRGGLTFEVNPSPVEQMTHGQT